MEYSELLNHKSKCRVCFITSMSKSNRIRISDEIESNFLAVTQVELRRSKNYSDEICRYCEKQLASFSLFKSYAGKIQQKLYETHPAADIEVKPVFLDIVIKQEVHQDENFPSNNSSTEPLVEIEAENLETATKSKNNEIPTKETKTICPDCGAHVKTLSAHWRRMHQKLINFICDLCDYKALQKSRMISHMQKHAVKKFREKFNCKYCSFETINKPYLADHEKAHASDKNNFHQCQCGKEFSNKSRLTQHIVMTHERKFKFKCNFCLKLFPSKAVLNDHIETNHTKIDIRDCVCKICSKSFITKNQLKAHVKDHHTESRFKCTFDGCSKKFNRNWRLQNHMSTHTHNKTFHCDKCPASYFHVKDLQRHQEAEHLGIRYPCEVPGCSINFRRRDNYRVHLKKSHSSMEPKFIEILLKKSREKLT